MRKLKKALSMTLALALSLALAVPAFAEGESWGLEVAGKADDAVVMPNASYQLRDWIVENYVLTGLGEASGKEFGMDVKLERGDTVLLNAENFSSPSVDAWSDPDGDGVYDQRVFKSRGEGEKVDEVMPTTTTGPLEMYAELENGEVVTYDTFCVLNEKGQLVSAGPMPSISSDSGSVWLEVSLSVDDLLQQFGPNTILCISYYDWSQGSQLGWALHLPGAASEQPTTPDAGTAYVVSAKQGLNVRTGPGANYPKARAALARNTAVQVVEVQGQWGRLANDAGWVFMPGLKAVSVPATPTTPETPEQTFPVTMVVKNSKGALNVRTGPGTNYKIATVPLRNGSVITIDKIEGQWGRLANYMDWWVYLPGAKTVKG